jgi:hypothetical protein
MEHHMRVAAAEFAKVKEMLSLAAIDMYGTPSPTLLDQMQAKARLLGDATSTVHDLHAGFTRLGPDRH